MGVHDTKLYKSIVEGHELSEITDHIGKIANINFQCKGRPTALHTAVMYNNVQVAALLLQRGADMTTAPLAKKYPNEFDCTLLFAFKQGESHEDMQFFLLRHLSECSRDQFDSMALKNIARVAHYAMMYCSTRVFFAAEEMKTKITVVTPTDLTPLMFTIIQVGLHEENVDKCAKILDRVVEIIDKDSTNIWQRYYCSNIAKRGSLLPFTGGTALGMLLFFVLADRRKRCTEYAAYLARVQRGNACMPATDPHHNSMVQFGIECDAKQKRIHEKNQAMMRYLANDFAPCLFARMLPSMRVALCMGTHDRLGNRHNCSVGEIGGDIMYTIFDQLVRGIVTSPEEYKYMLY